MALLQTTFAPLILAMPLACTENGTVWNWKHCLTAGHDCSLLQKNPVTLVPKLGVAYVEVRKSGSEGIRSGLEKFFNSTFSTCGGFGAPSPNCSSMGRCTSSCLDQSQANKYFWFSFVRNPTERFYSGLAQVSKMSHNKTLFLSPKVADMLNTTDLTCAFNAHSHLFAACTSSPAPI